MKGSCVRVTLPAPAAGRSLAGPAGFMFPAGVGRYCALSVKKYGIFFGCVILFNIAAGNMGLIEENRSFAFKERALFQAAVPGVIFRKGHKRPLFSES